MVTKALDDVRALRDKVEGVFDILCGKSFSKWSEGHTHAVVVLAKDQAGLDAYRNHPDHVAVARRIEAIEGGIGIDFIS